MNEEKFKNKLKEKFGEKFELLNFNNDNVILKCSKHGEFTVRIRSFFNSIYGCKNCYYESITKPQEQFIKEIEKLFPEYDFSETIYKNKRTKIQFKCPKHGIKFALPNNMLSGKCGCNECGNEKISKTKLEPEKEIIKKSKIIFGNIFKDYEFKYPKNGRRRIAMTCKKHNYRFENTVSNHIVLKQGCKLCANEEHNKAVTKPVDVFINDCIKKFDNLYSFPNLKDYYINEKTNIKIKCNRCNNIFTRNANHFLNQNYTCLYCDSSKAEIDIMSFFLQRNIMFEHNYRKMDGLKYKAPLELDFWLKEYNLAIEAQGSQHYINNGWKDSKEFEEQQIRDQIKRDYCKKNNIELLEIPYWEFNNIEKLLKSKLNLI